MRTVLLLLLVLTAKASQVRQGAPSDGIYGTITGEVVRETPHFQIYAERAFVPVDLDWLQTELEAIHAYLSERIGVQTAERFALTFRPPDTATCPIRGLALFDDPVAQSIIFADQQMSRAQLSGILAHEIAHLLHARGLQAGNRDFHLAEGFATWAAGKYWQGWQGTPTDNVRTFRREERYTPLEAYYRETGPNPNDTDCLKKRDLRYNSWAAFIDFLVADYGMDKFRQLLGPKEVPRAERMPPSVGPRIYIDPATIVLDPSGKMVFLQRLVPPPPDIAPVSDFKGVYGLSLSELEKAWLEKLNEKEVR